MAIRPEFAAAIYSRGKRFEFRRVRVRLKRGERALIYEPRPTGRITGEFRIGEVIFGSPHILVNLETSEPRRAVVRQYLRGCLCGSAIEITNAKRWLAEPADLSTKLRGLKPPQSYVFLR